MVRLPVQVLVLEVHGQVFALAHGLTDLCIADMPAACIGKQTTHTFMLPNSSGWGLRALGNKDFHAANLLGAQPTVISAVSFQEVGYHGSPLHPILSHS